jgi:hypothetical protein
MARVGEQISVLRTIEESRPLTPAEEARLRILDGELAQLQRELETCRAQPVPELTWSLLNPFGIQVDPAGTTWHAGHVTDVLELHDGVLLVGSVNGGIWQVRSNGDAMPLSNQWSNADVACLAFGPDGFRDAPHVFVGTTRSIGDASFWVNDPEASDPLSSWIEIPVDYMRGINKIIVFPSDRRVVMAAEGGMWWARIPTLGQVRSNPQSYRWNQVTPDQGLPAGRCFDLGPRA